MTDVDDDIRLAMAELDEEQHDEIVEEEQKEEENEISELQTGDKPEESVEESDSQEVTEQENGEQEGSQDEPEEKPEEVEEIAPPQSWSGLQKENWDKIPPETRKYILEREDQAHKALTQHDEVRNFGKQMKEISAPYEAIMQAEGTSADAAFKNYLNMAYIMRQGQPEQKAQIIRETMQQFNIDPQSVFGGGQQQQNMTPAQIEQMVNQRLEQAEQSRTQEQQRAEEERINQEIEAFASNPENIYFNDVRAQMGALLDSGQAKDMKEAYEQAIWAHPQIRPVLLAKQQAEAKEKRKQETERKKKAATSVTGSPDAKSSTSKSKGSNNNSIEEDIAAAIEEVEGSARV